MATQTVQVLRPLAPRAATQVITLERGCTLRVVIDKGDDVASSEPKLYTNHPLPGAPFERSQRRLITECDSIPGLRGAHLDGRQSPFSGKEDWAADLAIHTPGTFDLIIETKGVAVYMESFVVEPVRSHSTDVAD